MTASAFDLDAAIEDLTLGDLETIEEVTGRPVGSALAEVNTKNLRADTIVAVVYVTLRRNDPDTSIDDARAVRLVDLAADDTERDPP